MNETELQKIIQENRSNFKMIIEDNIFEINEMDVFRPITQYQSQQPEEECILQK